MIRDARERVKAATDWERETKMDKLLDDKEAKDATDFRGPCPPILSVGMSNGLRRDLFQLTNQAFAGRFTLRRVVVLSIGGPLQQDFSDLESQVSYWARAWEEEREAWIEWGIQRHPYPDEDVQQDLDLAVVDTPLGRIGPCRSRRE